MTGEIRPGGRRATAVAETRERILDAAERLFAAEGIESVSLRRVGVAAGAANHFAVQYHFGDKDRLVRAIFERRLPALEVRRAAMLMDLKRQGLTDDPRALMRVMLLPLVEVIDLSGRHSYAAFLLSLHHHGAFDARVDASDLAPLTSQVAELLQAANAAVPSGLSRLRLASAFVLFLDALVRIDRRRAGGGLAAKLEAVLLEDAVAMVTAAIMAPAADEIGNLLERSPGAAVTDQPI
jgi:AcrR family transcriptional regulator